MSAPSEAHSGLDEAAGAAANVAPVMELPSSILPLPSSFFSSLSSWWNLTSKQTAEAELYLLYKSGYFPGAVVGNADACTTDGPDALAEAYQLVNQCGTPLTSTPKHTRFSTVGTRLAQDGKVGMERLVDIGAAPPGTLHHGFMARLGLAHQKRLVNTLEIGTPLRHDQQPADEKKVVLVHGYAAGLAFFFKNLGMFGSLPNTRFFALDWLGMGRSSRPAYTLPHTKARSKERVETAEMFFLSSLEQWREKMKIDKMVLVGHSLGGYLSIAYALKYPEHVERLILVSPVGIPQGSWDVAAMQKRRDEQEKAKEERVSSSDTSSGADSVVSVTSNRELPAGPPRRFSNRTLSVLGWLWDRNVSIFGVIRSTSFFAPWLISGYTRNRFGSISPEELQCMHAYCHGVFASRGSSEYCLSDILAPGAFARQPMVHRIAPLRMPITFLYGDRDWMDINGGVDSKRMLSRAGNDHVRVFLSHSVGCTARPTGLWVATAMVGDRALTQLVRVRSKDGQFRIPIEGNDDIRVLVDKVRRVRLLQLAASLPDIDVDSLTLSNEPRGGEKKAVELCGSSMDALGIQHGHLLYAAYAPRTAAHRAHEPSAPESASHSARPWEQVHEEAVDTYWEKQPGTIPRARDAQFCRHGDKGMCDYCMPLEPYDSGYHTAHNIKHLSFHAYLRKQNISTNKASSATFVPPLEEASYQVQVPCPSGQHPPWPAGVCTKCQPSAITLQRQPYRMVDHVEFAHPSLIEHLLEIWRKTNAQRFGFLIGRYEVYGEVPMGVKAVVEAIHEPPQQGEVDGLALGIPWDDQGRIEQLAHACGLQIIGMVYTDLEAADPTHTDPSKAGLVACKRHLNSYFLSGAEAVFAAQLQGANRAPSRFSRTGAFNSRFVTCILTGTPEGVIDLAAYQVSEQAMGMVDADMIEASVEPTTIRVKPSEGIRYVPEVFFRYKNEYGIDVKESAKPTFPVEYLIVNATHGFPTAPNPRFLSQQFPIENRPGLHDQDLSVVCRELIKLRPSELLPGTGGQGGAQDEARAALVRLLSDWHLLAFLGQTGILGDEEMQRLCRVAVTHDANGALDALLGTPGWQTLVAISQEYAAPTPGAASGGALGADSDASGNAMHFDSAPASPSAPGHGNGNGGGDDAGAGVACPHCTFVNAPGSRDCDVCGLPLH